ncbi:hypothetical protein FKQ51_20320 [Bacillus toyonensis]|uniref:hypothetical protein n=1 Tax=Bacillus toyonensis TaxID=155322 RepID=UPI0026F9B1A5|nr:hypothetical protein [Bacillus toyonensis]MDO8159656.1 hypothetical protein [Bacillus toyonensis]
METIIRDGPMRLSFFGRNINERYLKDETITGLIEKCKPLDEEGFEYVFKIRKVLETVASQKEENPHLFKNCIKKDRDRGFYYEVVMKKVD